MATISDFEGFCNYCQSKFLDFTTKPVTLKWFNLHELCKMILKQLFLAYAAMQLDWLWIFWMTYKMIFKKGDFDPILIKKGSKNALFDPHFA